ncbi:hypothetical protein Pcinc_002003 [Petrolisthes cinctipes]|uniref:RNA-directed DNA polymerase n=1 Tax=Petrolisthes cinctipes TaxID=88211 RepID=A0AAE1GLU1_PETCI|nr:hypothetical protein Pcinc_002003 [Petrolisthes cinctipes]
MERRNCSARLISYAHLRRRSVATSGSHGAYKREGQLRVNLEESQVPKGSITGLNHQRIAALSPGLNYDAPAFRPQSSELYGNGGGPIKRIPQEFDGKVSWEAYRVQFELLADQNGWDDRQKAVQLATSLKGAAMEILGQLSVEERNSYRSLVEVLECRYGTMYQTEIYRARFRSRVRARGEPLEQLAHDLECMAHKAYPGAAPNMLVILLRDQFIDVLDTVELKVQVKQAQPRNMHEALARALEFKSYVRSSLDTYVRSNFQAGHKREDCYKLKKEQGQSSARKSTFAPKEYWTCGVRVHFSFNCQNKRKEDKKAAEDKKEAEKLVKAGEKGQPPAGVSPRRCKRTAIDSVRVDGRIDEQDQCLLGLDYLLSMGCELNFCSTKLKGRGKSVPVTAARHTRSGGEVRALRTPVIPSSDLDLGCTDMVEHSIDTGDHRPIKQPARRMAPAQRQEMEKVMENLQSQGVIEKSSSPWTSAVVLVRKKDGSTFDQELERLSEVFNRIRAVHIELNPKKCHLFQKEVKYLGHIVGESGVHTDTEKVSAVKDWPAPTCVKDLRNFLDLCTYYRHFVKDFASIAAPLHKLLGKRQKFEWTAVTQKAFDELKQAMVSSPVLPYPDQRQPFILDCDASDHGISGVLSQKKGDKEYVVAYYSKKLSPQERNYCVTRKELLAVVKSLYFFHPFIIRTEDAALKWLKTLKNPEGQLACWLGKIDQHNYEIQLYQVGAPM